MASAHSVRKEQQINVLISTEFHPKTATRAPNSLWCADTSISLFVYLSPDPTSEHQTRQDKTTQDKTHVYTRRFISSLPSQKLID